MSMRETWPVVVILLLPVIAGCDRDSADRGIAVNEASSAGLMRADAVTVEGPESVDTNGGPTPFAVRVRVTPAQERQTVDADFTGSCTLSPSARSRATIARPISPVPPTTRTTCPPSSRSTRRTLPVTNTDELSAQLGTGSGCGESRPG
jgi:hypothetical protein